MEASVATPPVAAPAAPPEAPPSHDGSAEATRSTAELFEWSGYVHVGGDAPECEERLTGACSNPKHFHAWVTMPNPYQIRDIVDKARAAKARKRRALRDAGDPAKGREPSDSYMTLEDQLDSLREPEQYKQLITIIARRRIEMSLVEILDSMQKDERFEHHAQDSEEFQRLEALPEDERDKEEYERLQADMMAYGEEMQKVVDERIETEQAHLKNETPDQVIEYERLFRIEDIASEAYLHIYYTWAIFTGTRKPSTEGFPSERKFKDPEALRNAPPEVIVALREKLRSLEQRTTSGRGEAAGN